MSISVLLADDHTVVRDGLRAILEAQGDIKVVGDAANGREAVNLVLKLKPDITIVDITMPELNGIDAASRMRQLSPSTEIIILSMHANKRHIGRALQAGARGYLIKESAGMEVVAAVRAVHAGQRYLSRTVSDLVINDYVANWNANEHGSRLDLLSMREREVLQLVVEGKTSAEIASILNLSPKTVESYRSRLMQKLDIDDLPSLVRFAIRQGLTPLD